MLAPDLFLTSHHQADGASMLLNEWDYKANMWATPRSLKA